MPVIRLTDEQRDEAGDRFDQAKRMAKRFKAPPGYSVEEWLSEVLLVLVEAVAASSKNSNFEAHFYMRCRFRRMQLLRKRQAMASLDWDAPAPEMRTQLSEVLDGVDAKDSDLLKLRAMGADWDELATAYGCCARTVRRWYARVVDGLRKREAVR
jgi:hypothetical protein